jgi:hypothetical protein
MAGFGSRGLGSYVFSGLCVAAIAGGIAWMIVTGGRSDAPRLGDLVAPSETMSVMPYLGEEVPLARGYTDYEDYENDPNRLPAASMAQVERLLRGAHLETSYSSRERMLAAVNELVFPGFGTLQMGDQRQPDGSTLSGHAVEIPSERHDKLRYFVFREKDGTFGLVDDFVAEGKDIVGVRDEGGGKLAYLDGKGEVVLTRP